MKKFLIHLHIFYEDMYPKFKEQLLALKLDSYDLYVTLVKENPELISDIKTSFPNAHIKVVENRGYDVAPFVDVLNGVNLDDYQYVVKLHTKRNIKHHKVPKFLQESRWREALTKFISSKDNFDSVVASMDSDASIGMHADSNVIFSNLCDHLLEKKNFYNYLKLNNFKVMPYKFVAGTMFIARSSVFKELQQLKLKISDFELPDPTRQSWQLAHAMERLCGYLVTSKHLKIKDFLNHSLINYRYWSHVVAFDLKIAKAAFVDVYIPKTLKTLKSVLWDNFFCKYIISVRKTKKNKLLVKILRIPVLSIKIKK